MLEIVGASLVLVTVRTNVSLTAALDPSVAVTTIVCVPTFALIGVPLIVPELIESVLGAPDIVYVSESPESTSVNAAAAFKLYDASSAVLASAIAEVTVGASLVLVTVITKLCAVEELEASVAVITTLCVPTSELSGVPERTPDPVPTSTKLAQSGIVVPVRVID